MRKENIINRKYIMTKIIIVDENDKPISLKERGTVNLNNICRISVLWLTNSKNQILLAQRKKNKKYNPGGWGPAVGGTNEENETYESNIYKEAEEEIGITGQKFIKGPKLFIAIPNKKFCQIFFLNIDRPLNKFKVQEDEVEQIKWFSTEELKSELIKNPDNYTPAVHTIMKEKNNW